MADPAPRVLPASGGLFVSGRRDRHRLIRAWLASLILHGLLFLPLVPPPVSGGGAAVGELLQVELRHELDMPLPVSTAPGAELIEVGRAAAPAKPPDVRRASRAKGSAGENVTPIEALAEGASLSAYRLAVARQARQWKDGLPALKAAGQSLSVPIVLMALPGQPPMVRLQGSSGDVGLDRAALDMIELAVRVVPLPSELRSQALQIDMQVHIHSGS